MHFGSSRATWLPPRRMHKTVLAKLVASAVACEARVGMATPRKSSPLVVSHKPQRATDRLGEGTCKGSQTAAGATTGAGPGGPAAVQHELAPDDACESRGAAKRPEGCDPSHPHDGLSAPLQKSSAGVDLAPLRQAILRDPKGIVSRAAPDLWRRGVPKSAAVRRAINEGTWQSGGMQHLTAGAAAPTRRRRLVPEKSAVGGPPTEYGGSLLRRLRQSAQATLQDVCDITKISKQYLGAIEDNDFDALPAIVYIRGFVYEYARVLGLDPDAAARSYMAQVKLHRQAGCTPP